MPRAEAHYVSRFTFYGSQKEEPPARCGCRAGGVGFMVGLVSAGLGFVHDKEAAAAFAPEAKQRGLVVGVLGETHGVFSAFDRLLVDFKNHVAGPEAGFGGGRTLFDVFNNGAANGLGDIELSA